MNDLVEFKIDDDTENLCDLLIMSFEDKVVFNRKLGTRVHSYFIIYGKYGFEFEFNEQYSRWSGNRIILDYSTYGYKDYRVLFTGNDCYSDKAYCRFDKTNDLLFISSSYIIETIPTSLIGVREHEE